MYKKIKKHPTTLNVYAEKLIKEKIVSLNEFNDMKLNFKNLLENQFKTAIQYYRRAISVDPNYAEAYSNIAAVLQETGDFSGAVEAHRFALKIRSDQANLHFNYAVYCQYRGR